MWTLPSIVELVETLHRYIGATSLSGCFLRAARKVCLAAEINWPWSCASWHCSSEFSEFSPDSPRVHSSKIIATPWHGSSLKRYCLVGKFCKVYHNAPWDIAKSKPAIIARSNILDFLSLSKKALFNCFKIQRHLSKLAVCRSRAMHWTKYWIWLYLVRTSKCSQTAFQCRPRSFVATKCLCNPPKSFWLFRGVDRGTFGSIDCPRFLLKIAVFNLKIGLTLSEIF